MSTSVLSSFSPNQAATINSLYNQWLASPYSNNPNVLYQAIGVANGEGMGPSPSGALGFLPSDSNLDGPAGSGRLAYGPFQYNVNPAGGSLGNIISQTYGVSNPGQLTLDQQSAFTINTIGSGSNGGIGNWMSVGASGGVANVQNAGQATFQNAQAQGILSTNGNTVASPSTSIDGPSEAIDADTFDSGSYVTNPATSGGLPNTVYAGGAGGSFVAGNPEGYGASDGTDAVTANPDDGMFDGGSALAPGLNQTSVTAGLPAGVSTSGSGNFYGLDAPAANASPESVTYAPSQVPGVTASPASGITTTTAPARHSALRIGRGGRRWRLAA
jgi:hypothetical protein